ncbi:MAG: thioredoxin family protein [Bacteroidia bacterium]|nr:thioredoxin family protein [Bacteroidia bacterium]NNK28632.1 thioredoxin family protein [Flavobacteriaceae bacterium]
MKVLEQNSVTQIIQDSLDKSMSYAEYRNLVTYLVETEATSGAEHTKALINYTMLNDRRMKRWDKTIKVSEEVIDKMQEQDREVTWLVLTESWCGDAAHVMPVMNKLAGLSSKINFKVVLRDDNQDLMNEFLTNGSQSIPKLIAIDKETDAVLYTYGPRPSIATKMVEDYKEEHGALTPKFKEDLQRWYNKDKGQTAIKDLIKLIQEN